MKLPSNVKIMLTSSDNKYFKTDERRIGFQQGAKWMREEAEQQIKVLKRKLTAYEEHVDDELRIKKSLK